MYHILTEFRASGMTEVALEQLRRVPVPIEWRGFNWENNENFYGPMEPCLSVGQIAGIRLEKKQDETARLWGRALHELYFDLVRIPKAAILTRPSWRDTYLLAGSLRLRGMAIIEDIFTRLHVKKKLGSGELSERDVTRLRDHLLQCWFYEMKLFEAELQFHLNRNPAVDTAHLAPQVVPFEAELVVDGTRITVSERTRMDGLYITRPTILEIKTGEVRYEDKLAVAGYALAYESQTNTPIDLGTVTYIRMRKDGLAPQIDCHIFSVGITLRSQFVEKRNSRMIEGKGQEK